MMLAVKRAVDERRRKGRYLLTGSANLLLMRSVSETLAGRAAYLTLWPMTRHLIRNRDEQWPEILAAQNAAREEWKDLALRGGYPTPALDLDSSASRAIWFAGYSTTYLERDLQDIPARSHSRVLGQQNTAPDQDAEAVLVRHRAGVASLRRRRA